ncbi:MAG: GcrA family cell cycle regulator [Pseudomonadota bacterium]
MAWTDDRVEQLKELWSEGLSASQIANKMGGVTRNAVIGKVHRLGLAGRATPAAPKPKAIPNPVSEAPSSSPSLSFESLYLDEDRPTVSTIGNNQCKWPIGDPASEEFHFCGQPTSGGKPYCAYHSQLAFQPSTSRRETAKPKQLVITAPKKAAQ